MIQQGVRYLIILLALLSLASCSVFRERPAPVIGSGDVVIRIPASIRLIAVDNHSISSPSLYQGYYLLHLSNGEHSLLVQYEENWNRVDEAGHIVRSLPVMIRATFRSDNPYQIVHPLMNTRSQAEVWSEAPVIRLQTADHSDNDPVTTGEIIKGPVITASEETDTLDTLKSLWRGATTEERQTFRQWLQQQP